MAITKESWEQVWKDRIAKSLQGIEYGQVQITFHDGEIVQIDRTVRSRFPFTEKKPAARTRTWHANP
mgnify:CR=1 FL=1